MSGKPSPKKVTSPRTEESAERLARIADAKQQFLLAALNMSWQLMVTIVVPVFIGAQIDSHYDTAPTWTLVALFLGVAMSVGVVIKTLNSVKTKQSQTKKGDEK